MKLIININGNIERIKRFLTAPESSVSHIKIDEKDLSRFSFIRKIINKENYDEIIFASSDLRYQRFTFFLWTYILLSKAKQGQIIDNTGHSMQFNLATYLLLTIPKFLFELLTSLFVIAYFHIKFRIKRWTISWKK